MIAGNEIFLVQKALYKRLSGIFGLPKIKITDVAIALDTAVTFGMLMERRRNEVFLEPPIPTEQLETQLFEKMGQLGIDLSGQVIS